MSELRFRPIGTIHTPFAEPTGTPLLDIKPFVREFDEREAVREGWLEAVRRRTAEADDRFHR